MSLQPVSANRRLLIAILPLAGFALLTACSKPAETSAPTPTPTPTPTPPPPPPPALSPTPAATEAAMTALDEADPLAKSLGYVEVATSADTSRFPNYAVGSNCANCALYQASAGSARGGCTIFPGKSVAAAGWCSAWIKTA